MDPTPRLLDLQALQGSIDHFDRRLPRLFLERMQDHDDPREFRIQEPVLLELELVERGRIGRDSIPVAARSWP